VECDIHNVNNLAKLYLYLQGCW